MSGGQADEAVAAEALAADHGLEQERVLAGVLALGQLQVQRERGFEIGKCFRDQGNTVVALRGERFEFEFGHAFLRAAREEGERAAISSKKPAGQVCTRRAPAAISLGQMDQDCQRRHSQASWAPVGLTMCFLAKNME